MTLMELLPSLRPHLDPGVWPVSARWGPRG